jgi:hypothetical protein
VTDLARPGTRPSRRKPWRALAVVAGLVVVGVVGVALGEALHDNPRPGGTQSYVRTLRPLPLTPAARTTVTVTSSTP